MSGSHTKVLTEDDEWVEQQNEEVLRFWWKVEMSELVSSQFFTYTSLFTIYLIFLPSVCILWIYKNFFG